MRYSHSLVLVLAVLSATACSRRQPDSAPVPSSTTVTGNDRSATDSDAAARAAAERERLERERVERERAEAARRTMEAAIYFAYDRSDLTADARAALDAKLDMLRDAQAMRIIVEGHTDDRGSDEYNLALGQRRAAAAKRYLVQRGIPADRIETMSFGEERPTCTDQAEQCWSANRRDEFRITAGAPMAARPE